MRFLSYVLTLVIGWVAGATIGLPETIQRHLDAGWQMIVGKAEDAAGSSDVPGDTAGTRSPPLSVFTRGASVPWTPQAAVAQLEVCGGMTVFNRPRTSENRQVVGLPPRVSLSGVSVATVPVMNSCFSSGFGNRNGKLHKGVDFHNPNGTIIYAPADGVVLESLYRDDYGNMIVLDHGDGAYTRFAHLASFGEGISTGARVRAGQPLGRMGNTAGYRVVVHLHYEMLTGDYDTPAKSFGLTPNNPFSLPSA